LLCLGAWLIQSISAQSTFGTIVGTVTDPNGAVLPAVKVTVINTETNISRTAETNEFGNYEVPNLNPGRYQVTAELAGFKKYVKTGFPLEARTTVRVDVRLEVGEIAEHVEVTAGAPVITTEAPTIAQTKGERELKELPFTFRASGTTSPISTLVTQPGVQSDNNGRISIAGAQPYMTTVSIDGISTVSVRSNGPIAELFPSTEAIGEIRVSQVNNNAEFAQAGDITTVSKSGTNDLHGNVFWYHQNSALDARNPFSPSKPFKIANDFGFQVGGPVRRDRTFFFFNYEGQRVRQQTLQTTSVPPAAWRAGDLSSVSAQIRDAAGNPFPGNRIPADLINPVSKRVLELFYPLPNSGPPTATTNNLKNLYPAPIESNQFDARVDQNITGRQNAFARFTWKNRATENIGNPPTLGRIRFPERVRALTAAHNFIIRPTLLNELRGGYSTRVIQKLFGLNGAETINRLGIRGLPANLPKGGGVPEIIIPPFIDTGTGRESKTTDRTFQLLDNLTWTKGRHSIKAGFDYRRMRTTDLLSFTTGDDFGDYTFDGTVTGSVIGHNFAAFLLGIPDFTRFAITGPDIDGRVNHYGFFAQDEWRATPRLTLSFGLRYEYHPPFTERNFNITNFDRRNGNVIIPNQASDRLTAPGFRASIPNTRILTAAEAGIPERLRVPYKKNVAPRFGFAFRPFNNTKTVVRGGYGIYTVTILGSVFYSLTGVHSSDVREFTNQIAGGQPLLRFPDPFLGGPGRIPMPGTQDFRTANDIFYRDPYSQQWSLTLEQDIGWNTGVRITYHGQHTIRLTHSPDLNQVPANTLGFAAAREGRPFKDWNIIFSRDNGPWARFHGLTLEANRRFAQGFQMQNSWAWSKNLSNADGPTPGAFAAENGSRARDRFDLAGDVGNVAFTRRHRFLSTFIWEAPVGRGRRYLGSANRAVDAFLGGWQISGIVLFQTGPFLTPTVTGTDPSGTGASRRTGQRPDRIGNGNLPSDRRTISGWWDRSAFAPPPNNIGRFGNAGVGILVGPGTRNFSMALAKQFRFTEQTALRLEAAFANLFNHFNPGVPGTNVASSAFGVITSTQPSGVDGAGPRVIQIALRFSF
jgi:hypothetical protein